MDTLKQIVGTFGSDDITDFRRFLKRTKSNEDRKDLQLFNLIVAGEIDPRDYFKTLYPDGNTVAYQAARKRLNRLLSRFIALKLIDSDSSNASSVLSQVNLARYLFSHNRESLAWRYLIKAEKAAIKNDLYEILNSIYVLQIQYLPSGQPQSRNEIIEKWTNNKTQLELNEKGEIALSLVSQKIEEANQKGNYENIDQLITETIDDLGLNEGFLLQPRFVYTITSVNRKKMLLQKDFFHLEPFIIQQYDLIQKNGGFSLKNNYYKLGFLYMIAHTLYRNKKFQKAFDYLTELETELAKATKGQRSEFLPKVYLLKSNLLLFNSDLEGCVKLLVQANEKPGVVLSQQDKLKLITALGIAQFQSGRFRETLRTLAKITHSDKWCIKIMGREWVLKKALMEVILFIELEEISLVDSRLRYIKRSFRDLFDLPLYQRVKVFLGFMRKLADHPTPEEMDRLKIELDEAFEWIPMQFEDLQAVAFYAWLKGKVNGVGSHQTLLDLVSEPRE